jgi:poly-gamma-glutamate synthesis protein (capsule biosynthesis protein)
VLHAILSTASHITTSPHHLITSLVTRHSLLVTLFFFSTFTLTPAGRIERAQYRSHIAQTNMVYSTYLPPCYDAEQQHYPVLYLMHGSNEDDGQWGRLGIQAVLDQGIANGTLPPMIVVMPFGEWIANENQFDRVSWENVFLEELLPLVESTYRIDARADQRAIGGISRGGFWAFEIAFRHPQLFSAVGGHSAFFDPGHAPDAFNPLDLALNAPGIERLRIWLDRGIDDFAQVNLDRMSAHLTQRGLPHEYRIYPEGQHNNAYWRQHVMDYLAFYAASWLTDLPPTVPPPAQAFIFATNTPNPAVTAPTPAPTPTASSVASGGDWLLFVPAVAFPSLEANITADRLRAIAAGQVDPLLVLDQTTANRLTAAGIPLATGIPVVADDALLNTLWRDRRLFTLIGFDQLTTRYRVLDVDDLHLVDHDLSAYPFAFQSATPNFRRDRLTRLLLSGVTALTRETTKALDANGVEWAASGIAAYTRRADFFHTSNEVSFSPGCPQFTEQPLGEFCSKREHFDLFPLIGLDMVELSGNHNLDYGTQPYLDTLDWYAAQGIRVVGGGIDLNAARAPLRLDHHDNQVVMVACNAIGPYYAIATADSPGAAACDWNWLRESLPSLAAESDLLIVTVQYTEVEDYLPLPSQISDFRGLADLGADVVIGTQAHKPQTFEFYNGLTGQPSFIHYGLGNFYFDQPFWGNMRFFLDELYIYEGRLLTVDLFTGIIDDLARPRPMTPDEQRNFLAFMFNTQGGL